MALAEELNLLPNGKAAVPRASFERRTLRSVASEQALEGGAGLCQQAQRIKKNGVPLRWIQPRRDPDSDAALWTTHLPFYLEQSTTENRIEHVPYHSKVIGLESQ
jgi:hypothetical protein